MSSTVNVAIAIVINEKNETLISYRQKHQHLADHWEFPGGKIEEDEAPLMALKRELKEEIGIDVISAEFLLTIDHKYNDRQVKLYVWQVKQFSGLAHGKEGQTIKWVDLNELQSIKLPEANLKILENINTNKGGNP